MACEVNNKEISVQNFWYDPRTYNVISCQLKLIKMRAKLANLNDCAVLVLSGAAAN